MLKLQLKLAQQYCSSLMAPPYSLSLIGIIHQTEGSNSIKESRQPCETLSQKDSYILHYILFTFFALKNKKKIIFSATAFNL